MTKRMRRFGLTGVGAAAGLLALSSAAFACTNFRGYTSITSDANTGVALPPCDLAVQGGTGLCNGSVATYPGITANSSGTVAGTTNVGDGGPMEYCGQTGTPSAEKSSILPKGSPGVVTKFLTLKGGPYNCAAGQHGTTDVIAGLYDLWLKPGNPWNGSTDTVAADDCFGAHNTAGAAKINDAADSGGYTVATGDWGPISSKNLTTVSTANGDPFTYTSGSYNVCFEGQHSTLTNESTPEIAFVTN